MRDMIDRQPVTLLGRLSTFGAAAGILFAWTVVEKQFIEPYGIDAYLPFYRANGMCIWDVFAIAAIAVTFVLAGRAVERPR